MDYRQGVRKSFAAAYNFWEKHRGAKTKEQFRAMYAEAAELGKEDSLLSDLLVAVCGEIAREYRERENIAS